MANGDLAMLTGYRERLHFLDRVFAGGRVSRMPDPTRSSEFFQDILVQNIRDEPDPAKLMQIIAVRRNDSACLLSAMLQSEKPELCQRRGFRVAKNAKNTAFFVKFVEQNFHLITILKQFSTERQRIERKIRIIYDARFMGQRLPLDHEADARSEGVFIFRKNLSAFSR